MKTEHETKGFRDLIAEVCSRTDFASNTQYVHTKWALGSQMLDKVVESVKLADKVVLALNLEFVELLMYDYSVKGENIVFITDCQKKADVCKLPRYAGVHAFVGDYIKMGNTNMKFDVIPVNPPYNDGLEDDEEEGLGGSIWPDFIEQSLSLLKPDGLLVAVHPSGWRNPGKRSKFRKIKARMLGRKIRYLEIHNAEDGVKTFGRPVRYDWYVMQNSPADGTPTEIVDENGERTKVDLSSLPFIPNGNMGELGGLFAKAGEGCVETIRDSTYHTTNSKAILESSKNSKYFIPIIKSVLAKGQNLLFSCFDSPVHRRPKVIWSRGDTKVIVDYDGQFGISENCRAIVEEPANLDKLAQVLNSPKFLKLMESCNIVSTGKFKETRNTDVITRFRKDFWKSFV